MEKIIACSFHKVDLSILNCPTNLVSLANDCPWILASLVVVSGIGDDFIGCDLLG